MKKWVIVTIVGSVGLAAVLGLKHGDSSGSVDSDLPLAEVKRGDLVIDVLEGGNIQALEYLEITNEVKSGDDVKILEIVDEGYMVTEEDVANGKVLVRLDPTSLEERIVNHDVEFQETESNYAEAKQNIEIAESEAESEIKEERQELRFALLDFEKFVGAEASKSILKKLDLPFDDATLGRYEKKATKLIANSFDSSKLAESAKQSEEINPLQLDAENSLASTVNFASYLDKELLGDGEAEQTIRRMRDEALVAASELAVQEESVAGAKRLHERDFITKQKLENEIVSLDKAELALQRSETDLDLFRDYEFPKEAEKMLSNYEEALLSLIRTKRRRMAKISQVYARYRSRKRRYELELKQRKDLQEQLESCTIRAEKPGLVAYGGAEKSRYTSRIYDAIAVGTTLKTGQPIITIPDMSKLGVEVNVHESHIKKVERGQEVHITAESVPDKTLSGRVTKVAVLPDSNASRYNPSLKVYPTTVEIEGTHEFLKPGMSAKLEIIVDELEDVTYVPVQAVFVESDNHYVLVETASGGYRPQPVEVGANNNEFVRIRKGLDENRDVLLQMPEDFEPSEHRLAFGEDENESTTDDEGGKTASRSEGRQSKSKPDENA